MLPGYFLPHAVRLNEPGYEACQPSTTEASCKTAKVTVIGYGGEWPSPFLPILGIYNLAQTVYFYANSYLLIHTIHIGTTVLFISLMYQRTPLHTAAGKGYRYTVKSLIKKGADMKIEDNKGVSVWDYTNDLKYMSVVYYINVSVIYYTVMDNKMSLLHSAIYTCLSPSFSNDIQMYTYLILRRVDSMTFSGRCCTRQTAPQETDSGSLYCFVFFFLSIFPNKTVACFVITAPPI